MKNDLPFIYFKFSNRFGDTKFKASPKRPCNQEYKEPCPLFHHSFGDQMHTRTKYMSKVSNTFMSK